MELWSWLKIKIDKLTLSGLFSEWFKNESKTQANTIVNINNVNILPLDPKLDPQIVSDKEINQEIQKSTSIDNARGIDVSNLTQKGYADLFLTKIEISYVADKMDKVFRREGKCKDEKTTSRNASAQLEGAIFAVGFREYNPAWMEHAATSLRGILDHWRGEKGQIATSFQRTFKELPGMRTESDFYITLQEYYGFFSDIHHENSDGCINHMKKIYDEKAKNGALNEKNFLKISGNFIKFLYNFFKKYISNTK